MSQPIQNILQDATTRLRALAGDVSKSVAAFKAWAAQEGVLRDGRCPDHGWIQTPLDEAASAAEWRRGVKRAVYAACSECELERGLRSRGVPPLLVGCRFKTFIPQNDADREVALKVEQFAAKVLANHGGALILSSPIYGNGKTHLAVSVMAHNFTGRELFITNAQWLQGVRRRYDGDKTSDATERCQSASLLVFDDLGMSRGGNDELPLLHEIFDKRYTQKLPTVITTNLIAEALKTYLGARMVDRLRQSAVLLTLTGDSMRPKLRKEYAK